MSYFNLSANYLYFRHELFFDNAVDTGSINTTNGVQQKTQQNFTYQLIRMSFHCIYTDMRQSSNQAQPLTYTESTCKIQIRCFRIVYYIASQLVLVIVWLYNNPSWRSAPLTETLGYKIILNYGRCFEVRFI